MDRFDLKRLTDYDFERICKDILESELKVRFELFTKGRDSGIDLRFLSSIGNTLIAQCKHWPNATSASLIRHLANVEAPKVNALAPDRYVLATSVGLTPNAKNKIQNALQPHILAPSDIFGVEEIEDLLNSNDDIVRRHFRLWLSSASVLEAMLNKDVLVRTAHLTDEIERTLLTFAPNSALIEAQRILDRDKTCIISGIPGIGKTTLAQVLSSQYMAAGYELVELSQDVTEALRMWKDDQPQIFYYDDFLGQTTLRDTAVTNEDSRLVRFFDQIRRAENKRFVLTTREYILAQARQSSEKLDASDLPISRLILDLAKYTTVSRAEILYNHVYFSELPQKVKGQFASEANYSRIIRHRNFSPRLIAITLRTAAKKQLGAGSVVEHVIQNLDDPKALWDHMFKYQLSNDEIDLVEVVFLAPHSIDVSKLVTLWQSYSDSSAHELDSRRLHRVLSTLEGTLLRVYRSGGHSVAALHNPSVRDYMRSRLSDKTHLRRMVKRAPDLESLETLLVISTGHDSAPIRSHLHSMKDVLDARLMELLKVEGPSSWVEDWPSRIAELVRISTEFHSTQMASTLASLMTDESRPDYVVEVNGFGELMRQVRLSPFGSVRKLERELLTWAIEQITADLYDWDVASSAIEILHELKDSRADAKAGEIQQDLDERAISAADSLAATGKLQVDESVADEMYERLNAYPDASADFDGFDELQTRVEAARRRRQEQDKKLAVTNQPQEPDPEWDEAEQISRMMSWLREK